MSTDLSVVLAALLLLALAALAITLTLLRRTRRLAAAHALSQQQELARLRVGRAELERTSYTDPLTGVWNYRYLQLALDREIARCARHPLPEGGDRLALLLLEIDGFAEIRREHGHQRGGAVLRDLAQRLAMEVREADVFGRYGGEEFLVLLPDTDTAGAETVAERLRWTVRRHPLALPSVPVPVHVAVSDAHQEVAGAKASAPVNGLNAAVGISVLPRDGGHAALLLRAADRSLAAARDSNRGAGSAADAESESSPESSPEAESSPGSAARASQPPYSLLAEGCELSRKTVGRA